MYGKIKSKLPNLKVSLHTISYSCCYLCLASRFGMRVSLTMRESGQMAGKREENGRIIYKVKEAVRKRKLCM